MVTISCMWLEMSSLDGLLCFQPAAGVLNYLESSYLSIIRYLDFELGNTGALLCVEVGVKQEDLHEIIILRFPDLFLGLKKVSRGPFTIYYMLTDGVYIAMSFPLCFGDSPSFLSTKYFDMMRFLPLVRIQCLWRCSPVTFYVKSLNNVTGLKKCF